MINKIRKTVLDTDIQEILKKGGSFLTIRVIGLLAGYLFTFFIAKQYGAAVNGLVALSFSLLLFASVFGRLGVDINLVKFYSKPESWKNHPDVFYRVLLKALFFAICLAVTLFLLKDFFVYTLFNKPSLEPYIFWVSATIPCWVMVIICSGLLRAKRMNKWFAFLDTPGRFSFSLLFFFILWTFVDSSLNAIKAHFYGVFALSLLALFVAVKQLKTVSFKKTTNSWRFMREAFPMMISGAIIVFLGWIDTFILGIYESDATIGVYSVALKIAALTGFSLEGINSILMPKVAKSYAENNLDECKKIIQFSTHLNFYITLIVVGLIVIFRKWMLGIFGDEFIMGSAVLVVLCIGQFVNSFSGSVGVILQMTGHQKTYQYIVGLALLINIILNVILTPMYGYIGTAVATVISISTWNLLGAYYIRKKLGINSYYNPFTFLK